MEDPRTAGHFDAEVARVRASGALGESGRLLELFDFLAARGAAALPASQAEIAERVFGQTETSVDDATVRVYIHRLRKRLEEYYADKADNGGGPRLAVPPGTYALRLRGDEAEAAEPEPGPVPTAPPRPRWLLPALAVALVLALVGAFALGRVLGSGGAPAANALWQPFLDSPRPTLIVVGDYYMYGEIDPVRPEEGRLIRDFRVNSPADLELMQDLEPDRYAIGEDVGLNYLPFSSAYGLRAIVPVLARGGRQVSVIPASQLEPDMLNYFDVVYVGLVSGMALLEDVNFMDSGFTVGESYDELFDKKSGRTFTSEEARNLPSPAYYSDYGYIARFRSPSGALVAVVAGARDTGLRGIAPIVAGETLPGELGKVAAAGNFEALFQITGQQGADLSEKLLIARKRP
jgi:hypothetical protein